jgi:phage tail-like protein
MIPLPPPLSLDQLTGPPLGHRFGVFFFIGGVVPNPLDIRFQRVSGLSTKVETTSVMEGGQNLYGHRLPQRIAYDNLVLERGFVVGSPLNLEFNAAMSLFQFAPSNVLVTLFSEEAIPLAAWMFIKAYPVRWATADLNGSEDRVLIDTLELAYAHMQALRI